MGMKLKSGADLCGFQLTNFCVQGEASAPSDAALGRKYFHTNATDDVATGISLLHRERIYIGEGAWRATAYLDDIAAINEKLNLITGDTDTDTLINNLKDLEEFLKDFSETDKLKSLLDGKLDKSGGTINSTSEQPLILNSNKSQVRLLIQRSEENMSTLGWHTSYGTWMYDHASGHSLGIKIKDGTPFYNDGTFHTLIHSGNIGSYKAGGLQTSTGADAVTIDSDKNAYFENIIYGKSQPIVFKNGNDNVAYFGAAHSTISSTLDGVGIMARGTRGIYFSTNGSVQAIINSSGNVTIGASDLAGTSYKFAVNGNASINISEQNPTSAAELTRANTFSIQHGIDNRFGLHSWIMGNGSACIQSCYVDQYHNKTHPLLLNPFGSSVLIGTTTDSGQKLQVYGAGYFNQYNASGNKSGASIIINKGGDLFGMGTASNVSHFALGYVDFAGAWKSEVMTFKGDNVHIKGNLVVDGEVSAGGAGAEESTSGSGSAEGVSEIFTPTSTSMAFDHNLGEDVIVQVYEKSGNVWNLVMVDVEITSATRVTLRFGKTETTQHKVVIMGV